MVWARTYNKGKDAASLFREMDADGSGFLDQDEVTELSKTLGKKLTGKELANAMQSMDSNNDNRISFDEFNRWWDINAGKHKAHREAVGAIDLRTVQDIEVSHSTLARSFCPIALPCLGQSSSSAPSSTSGLACRLPLLVRPRPGRRRLGRRVRRGRPESGSRRAVPVQGTELCWCVCTGAARATRGKKLAARLGPSGVVR